MSEPTRSEARYVRLGWYGTRCPRVVRLFFTVFTVVPVHEVPGHFCVAAAVVVPKAVKLRMLFHLFIQGISIKTSVWVAEPIV